MPRRVEYTRFGGPEILELIEVERPEPGIGEVRVRVRSTGLNPIDWKIFSGRAASAYGIEPPASNGNDFAGEVDALGDGVTGLSLGDLVFGGARSEAQADYLVIEATQVVPVPEGLTLDQAGSLDIAARTAVASVAAVGVTAGDVVLVSAAAGGVGVLAAQLAVRAGATVIGTASDENHEFLRTLGVIPVSYGDGLTDRVRDAAPAPLTAVLDNHGRPTIDAALALGVAPERINTIADRPAATELGLSAVGGAAASLEDLARVAALIARGDLVLPIDSVYPLERVREAYEHLMAGHLRGKVVLATS